MKKFSKLFVGIGALYTAFCSKVFGASLQNDVVILYGVPKPTLEDKIMQIIQIFIPLVLFVIGIFVVLNKKLTTKVKIITISCFIVISIAAVLFASINM